MSEPWADARVEAELDYGNIDEELATRLTNSIRIATTACRRYFQELEDTARLAATRSAARWEDAGDKITKSMERADTRAGAALTRLTQKGITSASRLSNAYERSYDQMVRGATTAVARIQERLSSIQDGSVRLNIESVNFMSQLRSIRATGQAYLRANPLTIRIEVDQSMVGAEVERALAGANHRVRVDVDVNDRGGMARANRDSNLLSRSLRSLGGSAASVGGSLVSGLASIGRFGAMAGTAVVAVGALVPLLGALVAALGSVAVAGGAAAAAGLGATVLAVGTLKAGLSGLGDAFKTNAASAAGGGASTANSIRQVESAQYALTQAVKDEKNAQKDVAAARATALQRLKDLNLEQRGAQLSERDAVLSLREARRDLQNLGKDGQPVDDIDRDRAVLRVADAEQRLAEVKSSNSKLDKDAAELRRKGVDGADEVVAANDRLADAQHNVLTSKQALNDAQNPQSSGGGGVDKQAEALAKLAPNARAVVMQLLALKPAWDAIQQRVQNRLFAGLTDEIGPLARNLMPSLATSMIGVANGFNQGAREALGFINTTSGLTMTKTLLTESSRIGASFGQALGALVPGLLAVGTASSQVFGPMSEGLAGAARGFSDMLVKAQQTGQLQDGIRKALDVAKQLGAVLGEVGSIIGGVFRAASAAGNGNGLANITNSLKSISDWVNGPVGQGALTSFFQSVGAAVSAVMPIILSLAGIIGGTVAPMIAQLITSIAPVVDQLVGALGQGIAALAPAIGPIAQLISSIATAAAPLLPIIGQLITQFVQIAGPVLSQLMAALGPLIAALGPILAQAMAAAAPVLQQIAGAMVQLMTAVGPLIPVLGQAFITVLQAAYPILGQLASILGPILATALQTLVPIIVILANTFAQVLTAVSPILPILGDALMQILAAVAPMLQQMAQQWSSIVLALMPLIPPLLQIVQALLPPLIQVIIAVLPLFTMLATVVGNLVPVIVPVVTVLAQMLAMFAQIVAAVITFAANVLSTIVGFVTGFVGAVSALPGQVIGFFKRLWDDAYALVTTGAGKVVDFVKGLPGRITEAAKGMWNGIYDAFKSMINALIGLWNNLSLKIPEVNTHIPGIGKIGGFELGTPDIPLLAGGGFVPMTNGATRGRDSVLAMLMPDEYVVPASKVTPQTLPLLSAIRSGAMTGIPRYAEGGLVSRDQLQDFARGVEGAPYVWGGVNWGDCSGAVSALANFATGRDPFASRFATGSEDGELASRGFKPGLGPAGSLNIGWFNGGPYGGHTAATLPNGDHFEMGGARGDGQYSGGAAGADDPQFSEHAHLPPEFFKGLDPASPTISSTAPAGVVSPSGSASTSSGGGASSSTSSSGGGGTSGDSILSGAGAAGAVGAGSTSMPFGVKRANAWLGEQDFASQGRAWGFNALKEVTGQFTDQVGMKGLSDQGIDALAKAITDALATRPNVLQTEVKVEPGKSGEPTPKVTVNPLAGMTSSTNTNRGL